MSTWIRHSANASILGSSRLKLGFSRLRLEALEKRNLLAVAAVDDDPAAPLDLIWPTGGNDASTYSGHGTGNRAIDINGDQSSSDRGAPVFAAFDGVAVWMEGWNGGYGRHIRITSTDAINGADVETRYAHLSAVLLSVPPNTPVYVKQGQLIGAVGGHHTHTEAELRIALGLPNLDAPFGGSPDEGHSSEDHSHFELRVDGKLVSPSTVTTDTQQNSRLYKGYFAAKPDQLLSDEAVPFGPTTQNDPRHAAIFAAARPGEPLFVNFKGFDWDETVTVRSVDVNGNVLSNVDQAALRPTGTISDDLAEQSIPDLMSQPAFAAAGLYYLEGVEQNRPANDGIQNGGALPWSRTIWAGSSPAADALPLAIVVSESAPPANVASVVDAVRADNSLYKIHSSGGDNILVIAGTNDSDVISISSGLVFWYLNINDRAPIRLMPGSFQSVYVDAGGGNDLIDLVDLTSGIGSTVRGGDGADVIYGGKGQDILVGGAGPDYIVGGAGVDWVFGGSDSDHLIGDGQGESGTAFGDHVFGEEGNDELFVAAIDEYSGGAGIDNFTFGHAQASGITQLGGGGLLIFGNLLNAVSDFFIAKAHADGTFSVSTNSTSLSLLASSVNPRDGAITHIYAVGGAGNETFDFTNSPIPVTMVGGGGNDVFHGSAYNDVAVAGVGNSQLDGYNGSDTLVAGDGVNSIDAGEGDDTVVASGNGDTVFGRGGNDYVTGGPTDNFVDREPSDYVIGFLQRVEKRRQARIDARLQETANVVRRAPTGQPVTATSAPEFSEFSLSSNVVTEGGGVVVTVRTARPGSWARMELYADINGNGRYDSATDVLVLRVRGRTLDWRGQVRTDQLGPGTYTLRARLLAYDGSSSQSGPLTLTVLPEQVLPTPPALPAHLDIEQDEALLVIPHDDGDALVPKNELVGPGQIDLYQLTVATSGNHAFSTQGTPTVLALYDANGNRIGEPIAGGTLQTSLTAGESYYIGVSGRDGQTGLYDLVITGRNQVVNGTIATPAAAFSGTATGTFGAGNTIDYWRVTAPATATMLDIRVSTDSGLYLWARVADDNDNRVIGIADLGNSGVDSILTSLPVEPGKTYVITLHGLYGGSGNYSVTADFYPDQLGLDDTINVATALSNYQPLIVQSDGDYTLSNQQIVSAGQIKYYHIAPTYSGEFIIRGTGSTDTQIGLYHGNGQQLLAQSDDDADGINGQVQAALTGGEEYWVVVRGSGNAVGNFGIQVFGPDQTTIPISIGGLGLEGTDTFFLGVTNNRQAYFRFTAPASATLGSFRVEGTDVARPLDLWWSIEDAAGNITVVDGAGLAAAELLNNFSIVGGQTYYVTITSKDRATGPGQILVNLSPDAAVSGEFVVNTSTFSNQDHPRIGMNSNGRSVVAWIGDPAQQATGIDLDDDIYFQIFAENGQPVGTQTRANINDGFDYQSNPDVGMAADGTFWVSWQEDATQRTFLRRFSATGSPLTGEINSGFSGTFESQIAVQADGSAAVIGSNGFQVYLRTFSGAGSATSSVQTLDDPPGSKQVLDTSIAAYLNGGYLVAWSREATTYNVVAQQTDSTGNKVGAEIAVATGANGQFQSQLAANSTGSFAVVYSQNDNDGTGSNIYLKQFTSTTTPVGLARRINAVTAGNQINPVVAIKSDGTAVVLWQDAATGGSADIQLQQFDSAGNAGTATEIRVNEFSTNGQEFPALAGTGGDTFVAAWESFGQDSSGDAVAARRLTIVAPVPHPQLTIQETVGAANDNVVAFGAHAQNASTPSQTIRVSNTGTSALIGQVDIVGSTAFSFGGSNQFNLSPGAFRDFVVSMSTASRGVFAANFVVTHNATGSPANVQLSGSVGPAADAREPNATDAAAADLGTVASNTTVNNLTINSDGDQDWFKFQAGLAGTYVVRADFAHAEGDLDLVVYDVNLGVRGISATSTNQETVTLHVEANEIVYVKVEPHGSARNVYSLQVALANAAPSVPDDINPAANTVSEFAANGSLVGITASSTDNSGNVAYSLISSADGRFSINSTTGVVSVANGSLLNSTTATSHTIVVQASDGAGETANQSFTIAVTSASTHVTSIAANSAGFVALFDHDLDVSALNLYDQGGVLGTADITLVGASTGTVRGSVVVDPNLRKLTFIKSGSALLPDTYTYRLKSGTNAFKDTQGNLLDGNGDGTGGDDYFGNFTVSSPANNAVTLSIPDITRGFGQPVNFPANGSTGIPITIGTGQGISGADFQLRYNPALLSITGVTLGSGINGTVAFNNATPGLLVVTVSSDQQFSAASGPLTLVNLTATVPSNAPYAAKSLLDLLSVHIYDASVDPQELPAIDDDGVQLVAYFGDANGSQTYNAPDATLAQRIIVGTNSGLSAYQLADPYLIVDVTGNGALQSNDVTLIQRAIVGTATTQIPPYPGLSSVAAGGPDPLVSIPQDLAAAVGETIVVPVQLQVTDLAGITLAGADLAIAYDASVLQLDDVEVGSLLIGFGLSVNSSSPGLLKLSLTGDAPLALAFDATGTLASLHFTVAAGAGTSSAINLLASGDALHTALYDALGRGLTLLPAPTNSADDSVDGRIQIRPTSRDQYVAAVDDVFSDFEMGPI